VAASASGAGPTAPVTLPAGVPVVLQWVPVPLARWLGVSVAPSVRATQTALAHSLLAQRAADGTDLCVHTYERVVYVIG
jgi:hypothetical protein